MSRGRSKSKPKRPGTSAALARAARDQRILAALAAGMSLGDVGGLYGLSRARVSQIRSRSLESLTRGKRESERRADLAPTAPASAERAAPPPSRGAGPKAVAEAERLRRATESRARTAALNRPESHPECPGRYYDDDEAEFLRACEAYRTRYQIRFLTATDYLRIAKDMGYARNVN